MEWTSTVLSGERHGRAVTVRLGGDEGAGASEVSVATPGCREFAASSMEEWRRAIAHWLSHPEDERVLIATSILLDGRAVFGPAELVAYISTLITLAPGDLIATGTPGGVGHARQPAVYLGEGATVATRIEGIGECVNRCVPEGTRT